MIKIVNYYINIWIIKIIVCILELTIFKQDIRLSSIFYIQLKEHQDSFTRKILKLQDSALHEPWRIL